VEVEGIPLDEQPRRGRVVVSKSVINRYVEVVLPPCICRYVCFQPQRGVNLLREMCK